MANQTERTETHHLKCDFTESELREFSRTMAREAQDLATAEDQKKVAVAQFAESIARHRSIIGQMARNINNGYEMRLVLCIVRLDDPKMGWATIVHKDTGELVRQRVMTDQEHAEASQGKLPLEEKPPEKPAAKTAKGGK
jgi:hypothetical protein